MQAFGVVDDSGRALESAYHWRGGRCLADIARLERRLQDQENVEELLGNWYYGGIFYPHFGHFMTESLHRLREYTKNAANYDGIIFLKSPMSASFDYDPLSSDFVRFFLSDFFGINTHRIKFTTEFLHVEKLDVGKLESQLGLCPDLKYLEFLADRVSQLAVTRDWNLRRSRKIFLSRRNYLKSGRALGMNAVEAVALESGFEIIRPEEWPVAQQILNILQATDLYCEAGSALHLIDILGPQDLNLVVLSRRGNDGNYWRNLYKGRVKSITTFDDVLPLHDYLGTTPGEGHSLIHSRRIVNFLDGSGMNFDKPNFIKNLVEETSADLALLGLGPPRT